MTKPTHQRVRELREDSDLKQINIARVLGITQQAYSAYENGRHEFSIRHIAALSKFYNVSCDYLLALTECPRIK
ncbi:helix-turn-helix transcriptional regulator [Candidatus Soleaferrea massiliensis]|uniref:helix-turn-helix transcriptional regulator n=1 Tax=Candidatus Soleaferrea massiliensis TaxID=1470354 RepID=UPI0009E622B1|nr:helix-turn-helix transcriptional regulator [Candidatus Soleaferrea massiliensis]